MNVSLWSLWNTTAQPALAGLKAGEWALLLMLAASLVVLCALRQRYLLVWTAGWALLATSRLAGAHGAAMGIPEQFIPAVEQAAFVLAMGLFAGAILVYIRERNLQAPLAAITICVAGFAVARALMWPDSLPLRVALEVAYQIILLTAAIALLRARKGRWELGAWLVLICLPLQHLSWPPYTNEIPGGVTAAADVLLGLGMLVIVFSEAGARERRLKVLRALTESIVLAQQQGGMMEDSLGELQRLTKSKAAWFRLIEGGHLVATHAVGVSTDFLREAGFAPLSDSVSQMLEQGRPIRAKASDASPEDAGLLESEKLRYVTMVPVLGKKSSIGLLVLGSNRARKLTAEELEFLETCGRQLGIAIENFRLLEQALRSQRQWRNTFDSVHDIILAHDADFRIIKANQILLEQLELASADVIGSTCESVLPHGLGEWTGCPYCARGGEEITEGADPCFGGFSLVSTSSYSEQGSKQKGTIHIVRDITERRSAEEKYRLLFDQVQEGVYVAMPGGRLLDCNDAFVNMLGYQRREDLLNLNLDQDIRVDAAQRDAFRKAIDQQNYVRNFDVTMRRQNGTLLLASESSFATRDAAGNIERYQGFVLDVTEKRRAEDEMRRRNRELNALNAMAVVATQSFDLDEILNLTLRQVVSLFGTETGSVYLCSPQETTFRRRAGWGPRSEARMRMAEVDFPDGFGDLVMRSRADVITQEFIPHLPPAVVEFVCADRLPGWIWVLLWSKDKPIGIMGIASKEVRQYSSNDENLLVAISRQLATTIEKVQLYEETCRAYENLRKTQEQLLQSEKMSAVGQLISGVAHELNNPLTAILGYAQLLDGADLDHRSADYVRKLFKQAQRTHRVVQNLLSFARQRKPQKQQVDLRKVLEETLTLREYDLKVNNITLERDIPEDVPAVLGDPHQLEQVFLNITNNALDAMLESSGSGVLKVRVFRRNQQVCVEFDDSGPGIKDTTRIFDPFYTTKTVGKGTGLGLSICYGIVKEHGGEIVARNRDEGGATIEVRLPASETIVAPEVAAAARRDAVLKGRVLLVEDEEAVLEFERDVLVGSGADVVTAMNIEDTKNHLQGGSFDALVLNGRMPGGSSVRDLYTWMQENCAGIEKKLLLTFSSVTDPETRAFLQEHNIPALAKPFEVADLITNVRRLLQQDVPTEEKSATAAAGV